MRALLLLVGCGLWSGCWRGTDSAGTTLSNEEAPTRAPRRDGAPCEEVADHSRDIVMAGGDDSLRRRADQIRDAIARRCAADGWSMELRRCLAGAKTLDDTDGCEKLATKEQQEALEHEVELMENAD